MPPRRPSIVKEEEVLEPLDEEPDAQLANGSIEDEKDNLNINEGQPSSAAEPQTQTDPAVKTHSRGRWAVKDHVPHPFVAKLAAEKAGISASDPEQRQAYENFVYEEALIVTGLKNQRNQTPYAEKRTKSHWDHVMEEMEWLSNEFIRERKWKLGQCKRFSANVSRSGLGIEARTLIREKQEADAMRKKAVVVAKHVAAFWSKAKRVAHTKIHIQIEAQKKEALDKNLDLILGQTEKYSKILAAELAPDAAGPSANVAKQRADKKVRFSAADKIKEEDEENEPEADLGVADLLGGEAGDAYEAGKGKGTKRRRRSSPEENGSGPSKSKIPRTEPGTSKDAQDSLEDQPPAPPTSSVKKEDDEEYDADEDSEDDEETLAEEEALVSKNLTAAKVELKEELDGLDEEAELSIEELMARYGYVVPGKDDEIVRDEVIERLAQGKADAGSSHMDRSSQKPPPPPSASASTSKESNDTDANNNNHASEAAAAAGGPEAPAEDEDAFEAAARDALSAMPTGFTLSTTQVKTKVPFLLKFELREYQHIGLDWLATLYQRKLNGILADEMGLGKTIQAISLLAWLACEEGCWGPHLIVVPTSVMLNWEMEFKKWCPAFKLLTYYGSAAKRKALRQGWSKPNAFHVCITSYTLVLQDAKMFRRKKWRYLILDEAHMIKNWKSQRWQTLLRFNAKRRLLITGTPLQNDLMELWSLMHFLMPSVFASHDQFRDWFCNPLTGMVEGSEAYNKQLVERLHGVLRPFLLRRTKAEVEKQMPAKHEHVLRVRLSKRQRLMYEEYMAATDVQETLKGGSFLGIINVLMQLRKVCNHPDLFEGRPIVSSFEMPPINIQMPSPILSICLSPATTYSPSLLTLGGLNGTSASSSLLDTLSSALSSSVSSPDSASSSWLTAWESSEVERLQVGYNDMKRMFGDPTAYCPDGLVNGGPAPTSSLMGQLAVHQSYMGALSSSPSLRVLANFLQARQRKHHAPSRLSTLAMLSQCNLDRCSTSHLPLYGPDIFSLISGWVPSPEGGSRARNPQRVTVLDFDLGAADEQALNRIEVQGEGEGEGEGGGGDRSLMMLTGEDRSQWWRKELVPGRPSALGRPSAAQKYASPLCLSSLVQQIGLVTHESRAEMLEDLLTRFLIFIPKARTVAQEVWCSRPDLTMVRRAAEATFISQQSWFKSSAPLRTALVRQQMFMPDAKLVQYDCGKLQEMASLLRRLKAGGHRCLIFTQMARMLDILEVFMNLHGHTYMRLDGSTKPEQRQILMTRFNSDPKVFCFILSTRSGGVGINLTGADTVIFYDSDWNPAMDAQAQDRCHRIGQTREVHIYRLVSENTIEENILKKSDQKRQLDFLAIQSAGFTTDILQKINVRDFFGAAEGGRGGGSGMSAEEVRIALRSAEDDADVAAAAEAEKEAQGEAEEFAGEGLAKTAAGGGGEVSDDLSDDPDPQEKEGGRKRSLSPAAGGSASLLVDDAEIIPLMPEVVGQQGRTTQDILASLDATLKPIEKYAIRFYEELNPPPAAAVATAVNKVTEGMKEEVWDLDEMRRRKEEQEAEAEESDDAPLVEEWDLGTATNTYQEYAVIVKQQIDQQEAYDLEMAELEAAEKAAAAAASKVKGKSGYQDEEYFYDEDENYGARASAMQDGGRWMYGLTGGMDGGGDGLAGPSGGGGEGEEGGANQPFSRSGRMIQGARRLRDGSPMFGVQGRRGGEGTRRYPPEIATGSWLEGVSPLVFPDSHPVADPDPLLTHKDRLFFPSQEYPLHLPWLSHLDGPLSTVVSSLTTRLQLRQQLPLSELPWGDFIAPEVLAEAAAAGGGRVANAGSAALANAERCRTRFAQLHTALMASQGLVAQDSLLQQGAAEMQAAYADIDEEAFQRMEAAVRGGAMGGRLSVFIVDVSTARSGGDARAPAAFVDPSLIGVSQFDADQVNRAVGRVRGMPRLMH